MVLHFILTRCQNKNRRCDWQVPFPEGKAVKVRFLKNLVRNVKATGPAAKITNLGALKIVLGIRRFLLYLLFIMVFSFAAGIIVNSTI